MGLLQRLIGTEEPKLSVHAFAAALGEYRNGEITGAQAKAAWDVQSGQETTKLNALLARLDAGTITETDVENVLILAETGNPFDLDANGLELRYYTQAQVVARLFP